MRGTRLALLLVLSALVRTPRVAAQEPVPTPEPTELDSAPAATPEEPPPAPSAPVPASSASGAPEVAAPAGDAATTASAATSPPATPTKSEPTADSVSAALVANEADASDAAGDTASEDVQAHPFEIYGFADIYFAAPFYRPNSPYAAAGLGSHTFFSIGNFNLYLSKSLDESWSFLGEVRFLYAPNGANDPANPGTRISTQVGDYADIDRPFRWGAIEVERLHVDYRHSELFSLRLGQWLTPYGIWNIDHGSPTVIAIQRPYIVGEELFPEQQTGLQAFGQAFAGDLKLGYALGVSNGRGPMDQQRDLDYDKAFTGRLEAGYNGLGDLRVGSSYYRGRYTNASFPLIDASTASADRKVLEQYYEQSFGADLQWDYEKFLLRSEFAYSERWYQGGVRKVVSPGQVYPDRRRYGAYVLAGYRTPFFDLMPYAILQHYVLGHDPVLPQLDRLRAYHAGINWAVTPSVTAKGEYVYVIFPDAASLLTERDTLHLVQFQLAVAF
ncbi:MAG: hypothetical protein SFV15_00170 [Polyangiaceae bacterium]|nr:hypothetical protein [Polyangiaceae bacterium]